MKMEIMKVIDEFEMHFNHYPHCLKWKKQVAPILAYYRGKDYIRIDMYTNHFLKTNNPDNRRYQVTSYIEERYRTNKVFYTFEDSYRYLLDYMNKNKIRFTLG